MLRYPFLLAGLVLLVPHCYIWLSIRTYHEPPNPLEYYPQDFWHLYFYSDTLFSAADIQCLYIF